MIEQKQTAAVILEDGEDIRESIKMSLDLDSVGDIMQILSKNLYSDSIGSTVREVASNALDSHRAAGVTDKPIIVTLGYVNGNYAFTVEDFGTGLDHDDVVKIIAKYGKSTSRGVADRLGMMGLGFKSPLSYVSSFTFIARKDGIERKYTMSEGEDKENVIDLIDEDSTSLPNGVKVIIPVDSSDVVTFFTKIKEQLSYFEGVYFEVNLSSSYAIDNGFKITRFDDFQMSELSTDSSMHICLDNVYYPLDFKKLEIDPISVPVGLRFSLSDGIFPTPNREAIRYTSQAKALIMKKIVTVSSKLVEMYNKTVEDDNDIISVIKFYQTRETLLNLGHKNVIDLDKVKDWSTIQIKEPTVKDLPFTDFKHITEILSVIGKEYEIKYEVRRNKIREIKYDASFNIATVLLPDYTIYKFTDRIGGNKKEYIKSLKRYIETVHFIKKVRSRKLFHSEGSLASYYKLLNLHKYPKNQWRALIREFQVILNHLLSKVVDADALEIPKEWLDARKRTVTVKRYKGHEKLEGEISCKKAEELERYVQDRHCKFIPFSLDLGKISTQKKLYIYAGHDDYLKLDSLYSMIGYHDRIVLITFSDRELKKLSSVDVHNLISYEKFMKGETKPFKRIVTAYLIHKLMEKNIRVFYDISTVNDYSEDLASKLISLNRYKDNHYSHGSETLYESMIEVANEHDLYDYSIYETYKEVKEVLDRFPFLNIIHGNIRTASQRNPIVVDLLKYHKFKVNLNLYKQPETLTENSQLNPETDGTI